MAGPDSENLVRKPEHRLSGFRWVVIGLVVVLAANMLTISVGYVLRGSPLNARMAQTGVYRCGSCGDGAFDAAALPMALVAAAPVGAGGQPQLDAADCIFNFSDLGSQVGDFTAGWGFALPAVHSLCRGHAGGICLRCERGSIDRCDLVLGHGARDSHLKCSAR